ncbi:MAG: SSS sodium solute transporter superfamily, partial [uncultured Microvirga sp.]
DPRPRRGGRPDAARQRLAQHRHLRRVRGRHPGVRLPGQPHQPLRLGLLRRRPLVHRAAERRRDRGGLPVGRVVPRHRRRHRAERLRRLPLLHRLPRRLARRAAPRRGAPAQHRQVHDGRRAGVPHAAAPGARRGRHVHAGRVLLLPARPDGRRRRADRPAAADPQHQPARAERRHRRRRPPHDRVRAGGRHEGHHLRPDHQGRAAPRGRRRDDGVGARHEGLQPVGAARRRRRQQPGPRRGAAGPRPAVHQPRRLHLPRPRARARHGGPAAHPHALLHRADGQGGPPLRRVGDLADRRVLPVHAGARVRRGRPRRAR